jgi:hypothetical protein
MARFYSGSREFNPQYGDLDWRALFAAKLAVAGNTMNERTIWFESEDGLDQECTQENTSVHLSRASDDMDVIFVRDPRDELNYSYFRSSLGQENFDTVYQALQAAGAAAVHRTMYPQADIVGIWMRQNTRMGSDESEMFVPEDW